MRIGRLEIIVRARILPKPNTEQGNLVPIQIIETGIGQRWSLCEDDLNGRQVWVHDNCDVIADGGKCIMCGAEEPRIW